MRLRRWPLAGWRQRLSLRARSIIRLILECGFLGVALAITRALTVYVWRLPNGDVTLYHGYALAFWTRPPLFHALPVEYPPLAILPFTLTLLPPLPDYLALFAYWMGALVIAGYLAFMRWSTRRRALTYALYLLVGSAGTLLARFDIVPALVTLAALWATQRRRFDYAYLLIAAGVLLKLYPIFLLPVVLIADARTATECARPLGWREEVGSPRALQDRLAQLLARLYERLRTHPATPRVARGAALGLGVAALGFIVALALNASGTLSGFVYAGSRPLEVESTPASLLWLGTLVGIPARPVFSFASLNYVGPLDAVLKPLSAVVLLAACGVIYVRQARGRLSVAQAFLACLCAVIATNKVFSPQYLIWVLPIVAVVEGFDLAWLAVCALTTVVYPTLYQLAPDLVKAPAMPAFMPVLAARNLLLVAITLRAILRPQLSGRSVSRLEVSGEAVSGATIDSVTVHDRLDTHTLDTHTGNAKTATERQATDEGARPAVLEQG